MSEAESEVCVLRVFLIAEENKGREVISSFVAYDYLFCRTSKMSHERGWREPCASTDRDRRDRWLWRLVRPILHWGSVSHFRFDPGHSYSVAQQREFESRQR
jgi:hypothetical protein